MEIISAITDEEDREIYVVKEIIHPVITRTWDKELFCSHCRAYNCKHVIFVKENSNKA